MGIFYSFQERIAAKKIEKLEELAFKLKRNAIEWIDREIKQLSDFPESVKRSQHEKDKILAMETRFFQLKERFKHHPLERLRIAQDWFDYALVCTQLHGSFDLLNAEGDFELFEESSKENHIKIEEIEKRFESLISNH